MIANKKIVLTGASSGIGLEVLRLLSAESSNLILAISRHAAEKLSDLAPNVVPFDCDVGSREGVDAVFDKAAEVFGGAKIDIFYANAGFPYYETFDYTNWDRIARIFEVNTISPIYSYSKYLHHLDGRDGHMAYTVSAIGQMAMPGYALYSATKFALHGFQQAIRLEKPGNMKLTCLYPIATDTNFFKVAAPIDFEKPFPVQDPKVVARKMVAALDKGKKSVSPSGLFTFAKGLMTVLPPVRSVYWGLEKGKLGRFAANMRGAGFKQ